jgi:hypothetical protein
MLRSTSVAIGTSILKGSFPERNRRETGQCQGSADNRRGERPTRREKTGTHPVEELIEAIQCAEDRDPAETPLVDVVGRRAADLSGRQDLGHPVARHLKQLGQGVQLDLPRCVIGL